jgi:hypothetical protein
MDTFHEYHCTYVITCHWVNFRMKNVSDKSCRENQNTPFMFNNFFLKKSCLLWDNVEKYGRVRQATGDCIKANSHIPCRSPAMPCQKGIRLCLSHLIYTVRPCLIHTCHATTMPFWKRLLKATAQRSMAWCVWISIGRPETACGRPACIRRLLATTRSSTKVVIRSIPIR